MAGAEENQGRAGSCFLCPILQIPMEDPVLLVETGFSYERRAIERWLQEKNTDPMTNVKLRARPPMLVANLALRECRAQWEEMKLGLAPPGESDSLRRSDRRSQELILHHDYVS